MIATVSIPGSQYFCWKRFPNRKEAQEWAWETEEEIKKANPAVSELPTIVYTEREAAGIRWDRGTKIFTSDDGGPGIGYARSNQS